MSSNWANAAAVLANKNAKPQASNQPTPPSISSASAKAALLAHNASIKSSTVDNKLSESAAKESIREAKSKALLAATKSMGTPKAPEKSLSLTPAEKKDSERARQIIAARQQESQTRTTKTIVMRPEFLTEHPPIRMEVEEKRHQDALHASALSLAKTVFQKSQRPKSMTDGDSAARAQAKQYVSLQDAAQKLASERLAKIQDSSENSYHGIPKRSTSTRSGNLFNKLRKTRRRSASEGEDELRAQLVKSKMSTLRSQIADVDSKRASQTEERSKILAAAERKVQAQMQTMDANVFAETGKMSPAMVNDWDNQTRARRQTLNKVGWKAPDSKSAVDVGAGKLVDRSDVEELAMERVGPTLKGIDEAVEQRKADEAARKARIEQEKREAKEERERKKIEKEERKKADEEERKEKQQKDHHLKTAAAIEELVNPDSIKSREMEEQRRLEQEAEKEAQLREKQRKQTGSAVQDIIDNENQRELKAQEQREKAASAVQEIINLEHKRETKAQEQRERAASTVQEIIDLGSQRDSKVQEQRKKAGSAVDEIIQAEIKRELKTKEQRLEAARTLDEIARGDALQSSISSERSPKSEKRSSPFSVLRRKSNMKRHSFMSTSSKDTTFESNHTANRPETQGSIETGRAMYSIDEPPEKDNIEERKTKSEKKPIWSKFTSSSRSKTSTDQEPESKMNRQSSSSKLRSKFKNLRRKPVIIKGGPNKYDKGEIDTAAESNHTGTHTVSGLVVPKRAQEDGESTELEDSSDNGSFHSTDARQKREVSALEPAKIPESSTVDDERDDVDDREDKLKGTHLETRFHEQL